MQVCFREWGAKGTVKQPFPNRVNHTVARLWSPPAGARAGAKAPRPTYGADLLLGCFLPALPSASLSLDSSSIHQLHGGVIDKWDCIDFKCIYNAKI